MATVAALEEEAVAGGAGRDAAAGELLVDAEVEPLRRSTGREDHVRRSCIRSCPTADAERALRQIERGRRRPATNVAPKSFGLQPHFFHQIRAQDAVAEARIVVDGRRQHQLAALLDAFDDERLEIGAAGVQRGRESGRAGPDDGDLMMQTSVECVRRRTQ